MLTGTSAPIQTNPIHQFDKYYYGPLPGTIYVLLSQEKFQLLFFYSYIFLFCGARLQALYA